MRNLKKLLALVLTLALSLSLAAPAFAVSIGDFADGAAAEDFITANYGKNAAVYGGAAQLLIDLGIVTGADGNLLNLSGNFTRAQFVVALYQSMHSGLRIDQAEPLWKSRYTNRFVDTAGHWAEGEIAWAAAAGYVTGVSEGYFAPSRNITFSNGLMLVMNALGYDAVKEGIRNLDGSWVVSWEHGIDLYVRDSYMTGVMGQLVAIDTESNNLNRAEAFYLFSQFLISNGFEYDNTYGSYHQSRQPTGDTWLWNSFRAVGGDFRIINDGKYFGLPSIADIVSVSATRSGGGTTLRVNNGGLQGNNGDGRAVIQRPIRWDRLDGHVTEWDTYILSKELTKELGITLDSIGRTINVAFRSPSEDRWIVEDAWTWRDPWNPGDYNMYDVETLYGDVIDRSDVAYLDDIKESIHQDLGKQVGGSFSALDWGTLFINYAQVANGASFSVQASVREEIDKKLKNGDNDWGGVVDWNFKLATNVWKNADIRVVYTNGKIDFVFIEYYVVSKVDNVNNSKFAFYDPAKANTNPGHGAEYWQSAERQGDAIVSAYSGTQWAKNDYVAVSEFRRNAEWGTINEVFLFQIVENRATGIVSNVVGSADVYDGGLLQDNGSGNGTLTLDGSSNYVMSASKGSRLRNFNTALVRKSVELVLWKGQIADVISETIKTPYCIITAAGIDITRSYNREEHTNYVDVLFEDGTRFTGQILEQIIPAVSSPRAATEVATGFLTANNTFGPHKPTPENGDSLWYRSGTSGSRFNGATELQDHIFRASVNNGRIILYEVVAQASTTDSWRNSGKVNSIARRFDETWGSELGALDGLSGTRGLINTDTSVTFMKVSLSNGRSEYRVYNKQSVNGFTIPGGGSEAYVESVRMLNNGNIDSSGPALRAAFVNATGASVVTDWKTHWAIALDWYNVGDTSTAYQGYVEALMPDGSIMTLRNVDNNSTIGGMNASGANQIKRGDVFVYESVDGTPEQIRNVFKVAADAAALGFWSAGAIDVGDEFHNALIGPNGSEMSWSVANSPRFLILDATSGKDPVVTSSISAARTAFNDFGGGNWDLYVIEQNNDKFDTQIYATILVKRSAHFIDNAGLASRVANTKFGANPNTLTVDRNVTDDDTIEFSVKGTVPDPKSVTYTDPTILAGYAPWMIDGLGKSNTDVVVMTIDIGQMLTVAGVKKDGTSAIAFKQDNPYVLGPVFPEANPKVSPNWRIFGSRAADATTSPATLAATGTVFMSGDLFAFALVPGATATIEVFARDLTAAEKGTTAVDWVFAGSEPTSAQRVLTIVVDASGLNFGSAASIAAASKADPKTPVPGVNASANSTGDDEMQIRVTGEATKPSNSAYNDNANKNGSFDELMSNTGVASDKFIIMGINLKDIAAELGIPYTGVNPFVIFQSNPALELFMVGKTTSPDPAIDDGSGSPWKMKTYANLTAATDDDDGNFYFAVYANTTVVIEIHTTSVTETNNVPDDDTELVYRFVIDTTDLVIN